MSTSWDSPFADPLGDIQAAKRQAEEAARDFTRNWGFDPVPWVEAMLVSGGFDFEGGSLEDQVFLRELLEES